MTQQYFNGLIDEVAIFNRALSPEEISDLYNKGVAEVGYCEDAPSSCIDTDNDGYGATGSNFTLCNYTQEDCNDSNLNIYPGATEVKNNGIDENCDEVDATAVYILVPDFLDSSEMNTYYVGDDINYRITLTEDGANYDSTTLIINLTDDDGIVFASNSLVDMIKISTGIYEGVFYSGSYSARPDSLGQGIRLEAWAYDNGNYLDSGVHFDQNFPEGTAPSLSATTYTVRTNAQSNYTVKDLVVNSTGSKINWTGTKLDFHARAINFDTAIIFADKFVKVDSATYSELNKSATLVFENVNCGSPYVFYSTTASDRVGVLSEDNLCVAPRCTNIQCSAGVLTVDVSSFSGYAVEGNANLSIDTNAPKEQNENITFTAIYRNFTDGSYITSANCYLYVDGGNDTMTPSGNNYVYQKSFSSVNTYSYNVTCSKAGFNTLIANATFNVTQAGGAIPEFGGSSLLIIITMILLGLFVLRRNRK
jgi:hypothetical protein